MRIKNHLLACAIVCWATASVLAGEELRSPSSTLELDSVTAVFFGLIDEGKIAVKLIPKRTRGSESIRLTMSNPTHKSQTIELPPTLVASPLLAQQQQPVPPPQSLGFGMRTGSFPQGNGLASLSSDRVQNDQQEKTPALGLAQLLDERLFGPGLPGIKPGSRAPSFPSLFDQEPFLPNGKIRIASGKRVRLDLPTVCLQYGNPDPHPRYEYQLRPLVEVIDSLALRRALWLNAHGRFNQAMTQAVAWHESNKLTWEELAKIGDTENGRRVPLFTAAELIVARRLVELQAAEAGSRKRVN